MGVSKPDKALRLNYTQFVKLVGGSEALIVALLETGRKPLVGVYWDGVGDYIPISWTEDGFYDADKDRTTNLDIKWDDKKQAA